MGILDALTNLSPDQNQGLLTAAAALLQAGGPSRTPTSFGQAFGAGLQGFQQGMSDAEQRRMQREQQAMNAKLMGLKLKDAESDLMTQQEGRDQNRLIQDASRSALVNGVFDQDTFLRNVSQVDPLRGLEFQRQFAKAAPEFDTAPRVGVDEQGKPFTYILSKGGQMQRLEGVLPREELKLANLGGREVAYNPFQLTPGQTFTRTLTPGEAASNAIARENVGISRERLGIERDRAKSEKDPTEFQGKSATFGLRAQEADKILSGLEGKGVRDTGIIRSVAQGTAELIPFVGDRLSSSVGSGFNVLPGALGGPNEQQQQTEQARRDFVNAVLRQESGAAIGQNEFENAARQYFPQPGDTDAVVKQKARNRQLAIQGLNSNAGRARMSAPSTGDGWSIEKVD